MFNQGCLAAVHPYVCRQATSSPASSRLRSTPPACSAAVATSTTVSDSRCRSRSPASPLCCNRSPATSPGCACPFSTSRFKLAAMELAHDGGGAGAPLLVGGILVDGEASLRDSDPASSVSLICHVSRIQPRRAGARRVPAEDLPPADDRPPLVPDDDRRRVADGSDHTLVRLALVSPRRPRAADRADRERATAAASRTR